MASHYPRRALRGRHIVFVTQNFDTVTLSFLGFSARTRLGFLVVIFYVLGMVSGGSLFALLHRSIARSGFNTQIAAPYQPAFRTA
jgi:hypothetical protein